MENLSKNPDLNQDGGLSNGLNLAEQAIVQAYISQNFELFSKIYSCHPIDPKVINKMARTFIDPQDILNNSERMRAFTDWVSQQKSLINQPGVNQPGVNQPGVNQLGNNQLGNNQLGNNQLGNNQLGDNQLGDNQLGDNQLGDNQLGDNQPGNNQPGDNQPGDNQLGDNQLGVNQLGVNQLGVNQPGANQLGDNQPEDNQPEVNPTRTQRRHHFFQENKPSTKIAPPEIKKYILKGRYGASRDMFAVQEMQKTFYLSLVAL
ncbi:hypothetical protein [Legionella tunisiensis]|uniref:hypothetical protein n=1 Tax=Legionella tunisiensis TaxID=1034944 RepID=UPI0002F11B70|nr:hypothetical protein [Legionella tunisiensis]